MVTAFILITASAIFMIGYLFGQAFSYQDGLRAESRTTVGMIVRPGKKDEDSFVFTDGVNRIYQEDLENYLSEN